MQNDMDYFQPNPNFKDQIHCLMYVFNAKTYMSDKEIGRLTAMKEIRTKHMQNGNIFSFFLNSRGGGTVG